MSTTHLLRRPSAAASSWHARALAALLATCLLAPIAGAQARPTTRLEARVDAFVGRVDAVHLGGGVAIPLGTYVRLAALAGAGVVHVDEAAEDEDVGVGGRLDVLGRFSVDPIRQLRWAPYIGAGATVRSEPETCCDALLALVFGVEGPVHRGRSWAFELGFGGGLRAAVVLRGGGERWR